MNEARERLKIPHEILGYVTGYSEHTVRQVLKGLRRDRKGVREAEKELLKAIEEIKARKKAENANWAARKLKELEEMAEQMEELQAFRLNHLNQDFQD